MGCEFNAEQFGIIAIATRLLLLAHEVKML